MAEKPHTKFSELNRHQKAEHIWEYYKLHIIGGLFGLFFIFWMLNHYIFNPPPEITFDVSLYGLYANEEEKIALEDQLDAYVIEEGVNETTMVEFFAIRDDLDPATQQATVAKMVAKASLGEFDIMIFGSDYYMSYMVEDVFLPLGPLVDKGILDPGDYPLVKGSDVDYDSDEYLMIDVSDNPAMQNLFYESEEIYMAIYFKANPEDQLKKALDYLLNEYK